MADIVVMVTTLLLRLLFYVSMLLHSIVKKCFIFEIHLGWNLVIAKTKVCVRLYQCMSLCACACVFQSDLVPRQVDVSAFSSASADKLAVRLWEVRPEGTALVPVHAKVQDANSKQTQIMVSESKKTSTQAEVIWQQDRR